MSAERPSEQALVALRHARALIAEGDQGAFGAVLGEIDGRIAELGAAIEDMSQDEALPVLKGMRELLASPARWTQDASARDATGDACGPLSPGARCWCLTGALWKAGDALRLDHGPAREALESQLPGPIEHESLSMFNDRRSHAGVLELLEAAIGEAG